MAGEHIPFRIVLVEPPAGVVFRLQSGKSPGELLPPRTSGPSRTVFEFTLRLGEPLPGGRPRFLGPLAQGPPDGRFVYVNSGTCAGQADSPWTRRAKVHLSSITAALIRRVLSGDAPRLEARIAGRAGDGGPACASVPLLEGWNAASADGPAPGGPRPGRGTSSAPSKRP